MSHRPLATWLRKDRYGNRYDLMAIFRRGEQPEGFPGEPSDCGGFVLTYLEAPPKPESAPRPEPRPRPERLDSHRIFLEAIEAYRTHGEPGVAEVWFHLDRGQRSLMGRLAHEIKGINRWPNGPPPVVRFTQAVVACADGVPLSRRPKRRR